MSSSHGRSSTAITTGARAARARSWSSSHRERSAAEQVDRQVDARREAVEQVVQPLGRVVAVLLAGPCHQHLRLHRPAASDPVVPQGRLADARLADQDERASVRAVPDVVGEDLDTSELGVPPDDPRRAVPRNVQGGASRLCRAGEIHHGDQERRPPRALIRRADPRSVMPRGRRSPDEVRWRGRRGTGTSLSTGRRERLGQLADQGAPGLLGHPQLRRDVLGRDVADGAEAVRRVERVEATLDRRPVTSGSSSCPVPSAGSAPRARRRRRRTSSAGAPRRAGGRPSRAGPRSP